MIQIPDITKPYPWQDEEVKYFDAPEASFNSSALEFNWLNAKANALGQQVIRYILLPTGEYEVHMSEALYRIKKTQFNLFADYSVLDLEHDFLLLQNGLSRMGLYKANSGGYYFHMMDVDGKVCMATRSAAVSRWIEAHLGWTYYFEHDMLMCQKDVKSKPMPVTKACAIKK